MKTKIALIGRPNVGKSALFNRIIGKRISIVDEMEGVTRDRLYGEGDFFGRPFEIIDTGGMDPTGEVAFAEEVRRQAEIAIEEADSLILVVDAIIGVTTLDEEVARVLKRTTKPLCLAVNKIDGEHQEPLLAPFYGLGIQEVIPVSAVQGRNVVELLEKALAPCPELEEEEDSAAGIKVALIGRPNVGKSTMINKLLNESRCVVSPIPGTTRDNIDVEVTFEGETFTFIDTAGIRRKKSEHDVVDKFAAIRTERAIERADVCLLMLDAQEGLSHQDKRIMNQIENAGKGCLLFFNKWDLIKGVRMEHCYKSLEIEASFIQYCPMIFGSAKTGRHLDQIFSELRNVYHDMHQRISTGKLNQFLEKAMQRRHPPMIQGKRLRVYYMAQVTTAPPRFIFFVNDPKRMNDAYKKYLINQFRDAYRFSGTPLFFSLRGKKPRDEKKSEKRIIEETNLVFDN
ncbi:ribosome biogenesis GTPase Der [Simkania negevensis]|uniref:GTPase Der n=1 Tax=Simkania negevensis (strain ATCC VR-1471 / DSM 27360 / Z) TaxID=331113 RepID=F8L3N6_SIMNZ|nr:ribosome biogenesis GTPase Der [Simkania negevensis]CCB89895.1 GTPase Der [Simkania negevensis Z]